MDKIQKANFGFDDIAYFWMHVKKSSRSNKFAERHGKCWEWRGSLFASGYGHWSNHCISYRAHRVSYYLYHGNIAKDKLICHKCDNRKCVNPKHLFEGTAQENVDDRKKKGRCGKRPPSTKPIKRPHYIKKNATSRFYCVSFRKESKKWRARCGYEKKTHLIGEFDTEIEAAKAYNDFVKSKGLDWRLNDC